MMLKLLLFLSVKKLKKGLLWVTGICVVLYAGICGYFYFSQEHLIFPGTKVEPGHRYTFYLPNHEFNIKTYDGQTLDGYLFKTADKQSKGLIFILHGNAGNVQRWSRSVVNYANLGYDAFVLDYPGYGKSTGKLHSLDQLFKGVQTAYDSLKHYYPENRITILGYSIGTGPAAWLAANNHPTKLLLLAPYYSLDDLAFRDYPFLPDFILKYQINTYQYIQHVSAPVTIFHGDEDEVVYYGSSLKLKPYLKKGDTLITLKGQKHEHFDDNPVYINDLKGILH